MVYGHWLSWAMSGKSRFAPEWSRRYSMLFSEQHQEPNHVQVSTVPFSSASTQSNFIRWGKFHTPTKRSTFIHSLHHNLLGYYLSAFPCYSFCANLTWLAITCHSSLPLLSWYPFASRVNALPMSSTSVPTMFLIVLSRLQLLILLSIV